MISGGCIPNNLEAFLTQSELPHSTMESFSQESGSFIEKMCYNIQGFLPTKICFSTLG